MSTTAHETPILLFRERPDLLLQLLGTALLASPMRFDRVEDKSNDLSQLAPVSLRADLVLVFYLDDSPVMVLVVEVQRAPDGDKLRSWPGYVGELVFRYGCPCYLVVVAGDEQTGRWAGQPNPHFQPSSPFLPLVLAPEDIPVVTSPAQVRLCPEVALLSLTAHAQGPRGVDVAAAVLQVANEIREEYKWMVVGLLVQLLSSEQRSSLEARFGMDLTRWYRDNESAAIRQSYRDGEQRGEQRGELRGKAEGILKILQARGLAVTASQREQILCCADLALLDQWLLRALTASSASEALERN